MTPDAFSVSSQLVGTPLATPRRRLAAIVVDLSLLALLKWLSWRLLLGGATLMLFLALVRTPGAGRWRRTLVGCGGTALAAATVFATFLPTLWRAGILVPDGAQEVIELVDSLAAAEAAAQPDASAETGDSAEFALSATVPSAQEEPAAAPDPAADERPSTAVAWVRDLADEAGLIFGWGTVYLTLFPALWQGRTPGKRLLGLRVVRVVGAPLGLLRCFERTGGYAAGFATGLFGFARVWWDPNRQAIHDKIAETVVVRERGWPARGATSDGAPATRRPTPA